MRYWEGIFFLIKQDFKNARWKNLLVLVMIMYISLFTAYPMTEIIGDKSFPESFLIDYVMIIMFSGIGIIATHIYSYGFGKKDLIAERLKYLRSLPIKQDQIIWARICGIILYTLISIILFYSAIFVALLVMGKEFSILTLILHGMQMLTLALLLNFFYLFCELILTLKTYVIISWIYPFVMLAVTIISFVFLKFSLLHFFVISAEKAPLIVILVSIVLNIMITFGAKAYITPRFRKRNL